SSTSDGNCEFAILREFDLTSQRNVAGVHRVEFPVHLEITHQILPPIACPNITDRSARKIRTAGHDQMDSIPLRAKELRGSNLRRGPEIAGPVPGDMRGQQRVESQFSA